MFDVAGIKLLLKEANIYVDENDKNFICICPYCGDHPNPQKKGHFYVSKNESIPVGHCWFCNSSFPITKIILDISGKSRDDLIKLETEYSKSKSVRAVTLKNRFRKYQLPELKTFDFPVKTLYMRTRTFDLQDIEKIPNLIFNLDEFLSINNINPDDIGIQEWERSYLQNNFVMFLSYKHSLLYCRNVSNQGVYKFRKIPIQLDPYNMLDYWMIDNYHNGSTEVILTEGIFNSLGCRAYDTVGGNDSCRLYASGCTFSYTELLKAVCFDFSIFQADVTILSDDDKKQYHYKKFLKECDPLIRSIKIVYNQYGKDFGMTPQKAVRLY